MLRHHWNTVLCHITLPSCAEFPCSLRGFHPGTSTFQDKHIRWRSLRSRLYSSVGQITRNELHRAGEPDEVAAACGRRTHPVVIYSKILCYVTKYTHMNCSKESRSHAWATKLDPFRDQKRRFRVALLFVVGGCFLVESRSKRTSPQQPLHRAARKAWSWG